ncbi:uncharacterized protein LOC120684454 [Panicum virgatum]|uniref:uncharacterized protein LOC120684454 n=1 Tax=Panicum virgatum TaxID=38727 RepID=UPI0019D5F4FE|nr:uncharacterized protein LOC120684454 [Panicum virgatum]
MAGAEVEVVAHAWKEWGLRTLVLLSFTLQVALLILAEFRRCVDHRLLRVVVWSAYMLADGTAIYVLGHLSATTRSPEHELMAFWAPFLLLHLGGQDNITAYAIEDNRLWLRHLQTLVVQVAAAGYVLYGSTVVSHPLLRCAAILIFVVGLVKYGERVWALRHSGSQSARAHNTGQRDTNDHLLLAYGMIDIARNFLKGPLPHVGIKLTDTSCLSGQDLYRIVEMQLSLMYDVFYTKVVAIHGWCGGLYVRAVLPVVTAIALLLFHLWSRRHQLGGHYSSVDIAATYVLLVGALVLEMVSALRAIFSIWSTDEFGVYGTTDIVHTWCCPIRPVVMPVRKLIHAAEWRRRYWSGSMGQQSLLQLCARSRGSRISKLAVRMGVEDWWNTLAYSGSILVSSYIEQLLVEQILKSIHLSSAHPNHIRNSRGRAVPKGRLYECLASSVNPEDLSLEESILAWHIATEVYLCFYRERAGDRENVAEAAARALSSYMLFLLAARPFMLPPTTSRTEYINMCYGLTGLQYNLAKDLAGILRSYGDALNTGTNFVWPQLEDRFGGSRPSVYHNKPLDIGCRLGAKLIDESSKDPLATDMLKLIVLVWVEMLCYAGQRCSSDSHAKQLSNGGELITIAAILVECITDAYMRDKILPYYQGHSQGHCSSYQRSPATASSSSSSTSESEGLNCIIVQENV